MSQAISKFLKKNSKISLLYFSISEKTERELEISENTCQSLAHCASFYHQLAAPGEFFLKWLRHLKKNSQGTKNRRLGHKGLNKVTFYYENGHFSLYLAENELVT